VFWWVDQEDSKTLSILRAKAAWQKNGHQNVQWTVHGIVTKSCFAGGGSVE
jgi:hypothetical protein